MAHSYHHAISSARKFGGTAEDYIELHTWFDRSKEILADFRHRALRHHAEGIFLAEQLYGVTLVNSVGRHVPVRLIGEQHVLEDLGRIPSFADWVRCIRPEPWMGRTGRLSTDDSATLIGRTIVDCRLAPPVSSGSARGRALPITMWTCAFSGISRRIRPSPSCLAEDGAGLCERHQRAVKGSASSGGSPGEGSAGDFLADQHYLEAMSASLKPPVHMTVEEFLEWDPNDDQRYELVDGMPHAMAPGTTTHGFLQSELGAVLRNHLRERRSNCEVLTNPGVVPRLLAADNYRVPDLAVTCSPLTTGQLILPDPVLIIEILSPSNRAETWANVRAYTSIPSVQEILVLHSTAVAAELLRRMSDGGWPERTEQITSTLKLDSIGFHMPLADLYARTPLAR